MPLRAKTGRPKWSKNSVIRGTNMENTPENNFWFKVPSRKTIKGCLNWMGWTRNGYGRLRVNGKVISAHRFAYELKFGPIPNDLCILHKCDNPSCVNVEHLQMGTYSDNNKDRVKKGRHYTLRGDENGHSKLKEFQVKEIKQKLKYGYSLAELGRLYGVSIHAIFRIKANKNWRHV